MDGLLYSLTAVTGNGTDGFAVDANVLTATGDGGFLMNAAEIETATRLGGEFTVLLFNDDDYGLISKKRMNRTGESFGTELSNPGFVALAESFGIDSYRPKSSEQLRTSLEAAIEGGMTLVEVPVE